MTGSSSRGRWLILALGVPGVAILALAVTLVGWPNLLAPWIKRQLLTTLCRQVDSRVQWGSLDLRWEAGGLGITARGLSVDSKEPGEHSSLTVDEVHGVVNVETLWSPIHGGVEILELTVLGPRLVLQRHADGGVTGGQTLDSLWRHLGELPLRFSGVEIHGLRVVEGEVQWRGDAPRVLNRMTHMTLNVDQLVPGQSVLLQAGAVWDDGGVTPARLRLRLESPALTAVVIGTQVPEANLELNVEPWELGPWAGLWQNSGVVPVAGRVSLDAHAHWDQGFANASVSLTSITQGLTLGLHGARGHAVDVRLDANASLDLAQHTAWVRNLAVRAPDVNVTGEAQLNWAEGLRIENLRWDLAANAGALGAFFPPGALPQDLAVSGDIKVHAAVNQGAGELAVDLDRAQLTLGSDFNKREGVPMHLAITTQTVGALVEIPLFTAVLGDATLTGSAQWDPATHTVLQADLDSGPVPVTFLKDLFPAVERAAQQRAVEGVLRLRGSAGPLGVEADLQAQSINLRLPAFQAAGSGVAHGQLGASDPSVAFDAQVNLTNLMVRLPRPNAPDWLDKPVGTRWVAHLSGRLKGNTAELEECRVELGGSAVHMVGAISGVKTQEWQADLGVKVDQLNLGDVALAFPTAKTLPPNATLSTQFRLHLLHPDWSTAELEVESFSLSVGTSHAAGRARATGWPQPSFTVDVAHFVADASDAAAWWPAGVPFPASGAARGALRWEGRWGEAQQWNAEWTQAWAHGFGQDVEGAVSFHNMEAPVVDLTLRAAVLDTAALLAAVAQPDGSKPDMGASIKKVTLTGRVEVAHWVNPHVTLDDVEGAVTLKQGVLTLHPLRAKAFQGSVVLDSSTVDLTQPEIAAHLRVTFKDVEVAKLMRRKALHGQLSGVLDLTTHGTNPQEWLANAQSPVAFSSPALTLEGLDLLGSVSIPGIKDNTLALPARVIHPTVFKDVHGVAQLGQGRFTLTQPLAMHTSFGELSLTGEAQLDGYCNLQGEAELSPDAVEELTRGAYRPRSAAHTPVGITGYPGDMTLHDVNARMFLRDEEMGNLWGTAGRLAQEARSQWRQRSALEVEKLRARVAKERAAVTQEVKRNLYEMRSAWPPWMGTDPDGGVLWVP